MASATMIAAVAAGGAIGAVLRYGVSHSVGAGLFGITGFFRHWLAWRADPFFPALRLMRASYGRNRVW